MNTKHDRHPATRNKLGTYSTALGNTLLNQAVSACLTERQNKDENIAALVCAFQESEVQSPIEAMLLSHLLASHNHIIKAMTLANSECSLTVRESVLCMANKLMKTFANHVDVYEKFKRGGHQSIKVDHVHVHNGGQAIVGNIKQDRGY